MRECAVCGRGFDPGSDHRKLKTCSDDCRRELKSRAAYQSASYIDPPDPWKDKAPLPDGVFFGGELAPPEGRFYRCLPVPDPVPREI